MNPVAPVLFWQYFDVISLSAITLVVVWIIINFRRKNDSVLKTISHTVAYSPRSSLTYSITMTIFFPLYYAFLWFWVGPIADVPQVFYYLLVLSSVSEMVFVWVPAHQGARNRIHTIAAGFVGFAMLALAILLLFYGSHISSLGLISSILFLCITVGLSILLLSKKYKSRLFLFETIYCVAFLVMMSVIAHF